MPINPNGVAAGWPKTSGLRSPPATTPLGLMAPPSPLPRVVPSVQPWALLHNRVAVEAAHYFDYVRFSRDGAREREAFGVRELAPAFGGVQPSKSAGKPDALQTLRDFDNRLTFFISAE